MGYCIKCGKTLDDKEFYKSKNIEKYPPEGRMNICKACLTMHVDNWDPETYKWILQEIDVPYIKEAWDELLEKYGNSGKKVTGLTIIGRYLSKMKLKQWRDYTWADTERLARKAEEEKIVSMKTQGLSDEEISAQLAIDRTPAKPKSLTQVQSEVGIPEFEDFGEPDEFDSQLTDEDKMLLRLKWGKQYRAEEWVRLEQLYTDMMNSYDIQTAGHKDTLIMICKASLKANQLIDAGDVDGFQKMSRVYDQLMKSGNFTAAQNKGESGEFIDSIGELVALCEKEGFVPRYYTGEPNDKVDAVLEDLKRYTQTLVRDEMNLGNMIDASLRAITKDKEKEAIVAIDDEEDEDTLFAYPESRELDYSDYEEFENMKEQERQADQEADRRGIE